VCGAVHVAEQEFVFAAADHSLPGRPFADEFPGRHERVPVQLARMSGVVFIREGLLRSARRG